MSVQNQQELERGVTLHPLEYRYLIHTASLVTRLGAQVAELRVTGHGVEFFVINHFRPPVWRFHTIFEEPRPAPSRALVTTPAKIVGALYLAGPPRRRPVEIFLESAGARVAGPDGIVNVPGRITAATNTRGVAPRGIEPLADVTAYRNYLADGVLLALARGPYAEMRFSNGGGGWKLHVVSEANDDYNFFPTNVYKKPEAFERGLYNAWILSELLTTVGDYIELRFLGNTNHPALHVSWDGALRDPEGSIPVATEFYLEE
jgi:hypothetical protein